MMLNNNNGLYQNLLLKYLQLEKKISSIKNQIQEKSQMNSNYKTELCKNYQAKGFCPYGRKCKFAHGEVELITKIQGVNYKKEKCESFYKRGYCPYGSRCQFQHDERKVKDINISYFYIQLFFFKYFGFFKSKRYYFAKNTSLFNKRLPVFESLTHKFINEKDVCNQPEKEENIFYY